MKNYTYFLVFWLFAAPYTLRAEELPIFFARSGQQAMLPVLNGYKSTQGPLTLWAFGKQWDEPAVVKDGMAELVAPAVRVPVVFQLKSGRDVHCELVVYPDRPITWDKDLEFVAVGASDWLTTWAKAMNMPIRFFDKRHALEAAGERFQKKQRLLILDRSGSWQPSDTAWRLACEHETNVLWFCVDWFEHNMFCPRKALSPPQMVGPLADLQTQNWPLPPAFDQKKLWILNRQTWISGPEHPLVEELRIPENGHEHLRVVWSYVPWPQQLGRNEVADALFIRLLTEAAKGAEGRPPLAGRWRLLYPPAKDVKADERPVLAAAMKSAELDVGNAVESGEIRAYILDLRGKTSPPENLFDGTGAMTARIGMGVPLLILGDSPILDTWKWLELDRVNHRSPRSGVVWWPDGALPASIESQLRLMQLFTEWNISLGNIPQETGNENRKNGP